MDQNNLLASLVAIDSVNPSLVSGAPGETEIALFVRNWLAHSGVDVELVESLPGRPSVLGCVRGSGGGRALMLYAHMDTVGVEGMDQPFTPVIRDNKLYGRGACDMKSGLAAIMLAIAALAQAPRLRGDVWLMAVSDEEYASLGAQAVLSRLAGLQASLSACIVTEPTDLQLCVAHRGFACATITTRGRAAHTSRRAEGIDAIAHMGRMIVALEQFDSALQERPAHPLLGHGSVVASLVSGGSELFTYPAHCRTELVRRTLPGETAVTVTAEFENILQPLSAADPHFDATLSLDLFRDAFETPADSPIVTTLNSALGRTMGASPPLAGASYWTDAGLIAAAGVPCAVFGPRGEGLHSDVEWVDLSSVQACQAILINTAQQFCA